MAPANVATYYLLREVSSLPRRLLFGSLTQSRTWECAACGKIRASVAPVNSPGRCAGCRGEHFIRR